MFEHLMRRLTIGRKAVLLKLSPEVDAELEQAAKDSGISKSEFVEAAIAQEDASEVRDNYFTSIRV
jgi:hypothetical protein